MIYKKTISTKIASFFLITLCGLYFIVSGETIRFNGSPSGDTNAEVSIENESVFSAVYRIIIPAIHLKKESQNGAEYSRIFIDGFSTIQEVGKPDLPSMNQFMVIPEGASLKVTVLDKTSRTVENILAYPGLEEHLDSDFYWDVEPKFQTDNAIYAANALFPASPVRILQKVNFRGVHMAHLQICPIAHNPVQKTIEVFQTLTVRVDFIGGSVLPVNGGIHGKMVKGLAVNGEQFYKRYQAKETNDILDEHFDYLIITTDEFESAANRIGIFKQKQGYDVQILTKSSWTTGTVKSAIKKFYTDNNKAEYFLIIGDIGDVPAILNPNGMDYRDKDNAYTDLDYALIEGNDYYPEMARGRLSVSSRTQAETVVNKIIKYQDTPPKNDAFYKKVTGAAYFQDKDNDGEEDRRYSLTVEELREYLTDKWNLEFERIYTCGSSVNPRTRNDTKYADGQRVPDHLRKPNFPWKGNTKDIMDAINKGTFLVMHRDHGSESGWSSPSFRKSHAEDLRNGDLLPLVFSLNCTTGKFSGSCLSESLLRNPNGGCVAVYGASATSPSGPNCALCHGLTDAFFVGTAIKARGVPQPTPPSHDPIYTIGDALTWGCISVEKYWKKSQREFVLYQCFGDPAMELFTAVPQDITAQHYNAIPVKAKNFKVEKLNVAQGIVTLYNEKTKSIIGRAAIKNGSNSIAIPIDKPIALGDKLTLYIWGHNYRPYSVELPVQEGVGILQQNSSTAPVNSFTVSPKTIQINSAKPIRLTFTTSDATAFSCAIYDVKGNMVKSFDTVKRTAKYTYQAGPWNMKNSKGKLVSSGSYIIKAEIVNAKGIQQSFTSKIYLMK